MYIDFMKDIQKEVELSKKTPLFINNNLNKLFIPLHQRIKNLKFNLG